MDAANSVTSSPSAVQSFTPLPLSQAETLAQQLNVVLWPGTGAAGFRRARDDGRQLAGADAALPAGQRVLPEPRRRDARESSTCSIGAIVPDDAIGWMQTHGYPTAALWYPPPEKAVIGLQYVYLASRNKVFVNGTWEVVVRVE